MGIILTLLFLGPWAVLAEAVAGPNSGPIMNMGNCWVGPGNSGPRIAAFAEGWAYELGAGEREGLNRQLEELFKIPGELAGAYVHCGAYGHSLALRWVAGERHYCAWTRASQSVPSSFLWRLSGADPLTREGPCEGVVPGVLIARASDTGALALEALKARLLEAPYKGLVKEVQVLGSRAFKFQLEEAHHLFEDRALEALWPLVAQGVLQGMEYSYFALPVGDFMRLW